MRNCIILIAILVVSQFATAQNLPTIERKGFTASVGLGLGAIGIKDSQTGTNFEEGKFALSFPDLKLGYMLNQRMAVVLNSTGAIYEYEGLDRSFEAFMPTFQYWVADRWWINAGFGLAVDMPALYDIKRDQNDDFNFGHAVGVGAGFEVYRHKNCVMDLKLQALAGGVNLDNNGERDAASLTLGIAFNWY